MRKNLFGIFIFALMLLYSISVDAQLTFTFRQITYSVNEDGATVSVINGAEDDELRVIVLNPTVEYDSKVYTVTKIRQRAFESHKYLITIDCPKTIVSIEDYAFANCPTLVDVHIAEGLTNIGNYAFGSCSSIKKIIIPASVKTIGESAFWGCSSLRSIAFPDGMTAVNSGVLGYCANIEEVILPNSVTSIGDNAFYNCSSLKNITIPSGVSRIGASAFSGCGSLESLAIPNSVAEIADRTFYLCSALKDIIIPNSVTEIGDSAFDHCVSLDSVTIPQSVKTIGTSAFNSCYALTNLVFCDGLQEIGDYAFAHCTRLTRLTIPRYVLGIGDYAFYNCKHLNTVISMPRTAPRIKINTFSGIDNYATLYHRNDAYNYSGWGYNFENIDFLKTCGTFEVFWVLKDSILTISGKGEMSDYESGNTPWHDCNKQIKKVVIENGITNIGVRAFNSCTNLTDVSISESVTKIGHRAFFGCSALKSIAIPDGVKSIEEKTFDGCSKLAEIKFGTGLIQIRNSAFNGCRSLTTLLFPASLVAIASKAFSYCNSITDITLLSIMPPGLASDAFTNISPTTALHIPTGTINTYKKSAWMMFNNIIHPCPINLTINDSSMGSATLSSQVVNYGEPVTVHISPNSGYTLKSLIINDVDVTSDVKDNRYNIEKVGSATTVAVTFEKTIRCEVEGKNLNAIYGECISLPIVLNNECAITAMQFDVILPDGVTPATDTDGEIIATLNANRATVTHAIAASLMSDNSVKVVIYSTNNSTFINGNGLLANLNINATPIDAERPSEIKITNIKAVTPDKKEVRISDAQFVLTVGECLTGDANMNGSVTVSDVVAILNYMFEKEHTTFNFVAADVDADGEISVMDIVEVVDIIIGGAARYNVRTSKHIAAASAERISVNTEDGSAVTLNLEDNTRYTALQLDIELPEGATLVKATATEHTVVWNTLSDGRVRLAAYSLGGETFASDALLAMEIEGDGGTLTVNNILAVTPDGAETAIGGSSAYVGGTTGVGSVRTEPEIISMRYFTESGTELNEPRPGVNIVVTKYANGKVESKKIVVKK